MKLEVGMYVRTKKGAIEKIIDKYEAPYGYKVVVNENLRFKHYEHNYIKHIIKASYNIIDLIEVGDYVNGYKIIKISTDHCGRTILIYGYDIGNSQVAITIYEDEIKSIVTKEQFESMSYKVEE